MMKSGKDLRQRILVVVLLCVACDAEVDVEQVALRGTDQSAAEPGPPVNADGVAFPACGDGYAEPPVRVEWGASEDGLVVPVEVASQHLGDVEVRLEAEVLAAGNYFVVEIGGPPEVLTTAARSTKELDLATVLANVDENAFTVSGQILVSAVVEYANGQRERIASEPRFFHPTQSGRYTFYDAEQLERDHAGGNFRGAHTLPADPHRMGFVDGGHGLPPEVVEQILAQDPGTWTQEDT